MFPSGPTGALPPNTANEPFGILKPAAQKEFVNIFIGVAFLDLMSLSWQLVSRVSARSRVQRQLTKRYPMPDGRRSGIHSSAQLHTLSTTKGAHLCRIGFGLVDNVHLLVIAHKHHLTHGHKVGHSGNKQRNTVRTMAETRVSPTTSKVPGACAAVEVTYVERATPVARLRPSRANEGIMIAESKRPQPQFNSSSKQTKRRENEETRVCVGGGREVKQPDDGAGQGSSRR